MAVPGFGPCGPTAIGVCLIPTFEMIDIAGLIVLVLVIIGLSRSSRVTGLYFPKDQIGSLFKRFKGIIGAADLLKGVGSVAVLDAGASRPLRTCKPAEGAFSYKWISHITIFWGFVFAFISTVLAYFMKPEGAILSLTHPVKMFGNAAGVLLTVGLVAMFFVRFQQSGSPWDLHRADVFLILLLFTAISGVTLEVIIYTLGRSPLLTAVTYWVHIGIVTGLFLTAPYTKFVHAIYKPLWILYGGLEKRVLERATPR